jgi:hypothetical protein
MKPVMTAMCKNCEDKIEWLKGFGWTHPLKGKCTKPVPKKETIK